METYTLAHFPPNVRTLHVAYFENVANAPEIRRRLVQAATAPGAEGDAARAAVDFAFIEAGLLVSKEHLLTGATVALLTSLPATPRASLPAPPEPKTRSHNLHSEVLMALSPNNNITDAIRRHGVGDATTRLAVVKFAPEGSDQKAVYDAIAAVVDGELKPLSTLDDESKIDWARVDKVYKLGEMNQLKVDNVPQRKVAAVVNTVAIKHVT
ncbi:hypothetical protein VHUM_03234 [Vanrija humicola]|uniref:EKC/KEOPS complex subunit CGI121 n=1 Tax=Vanrija humicola TaxID=5417 RepID=A0A7D8UYU4_VANHU|nr:hypothetical protein VHUM_03234 [Vanrija humicola]